MATYVEAYKGYIADVPRVWFKRCDKRIFYFDEITQANVTPQTDKIDINAGWSQFPVCTIPGAGSMDITMTSGQFNAEQFALANGRNFEAMGTGEQGDTNPKYVMFGTEHPEYNATAMTLTLTRTPKEGTVSIAGVAAEDFSVANKVITFTAALGGVADGDPVEVSYEYEVAGANIIQIDNQTSAIGEAVFKYPVYNSGSDCTESSIKGYLVIHVYRCRVSQMPGFDTSYKSAATNSVTWSALDAKRDDDACYSIAYYPKNAD